MQAVHDRFVNIPRVSQLEHNNSLKTNLYMYSYNKLRQLTQIIYMYH